jgi:hypothetical protein
MNSVQNISSISNLPTKPESSSSSAEPKQKGDYEMSEWAKLIIIWSLLQSIRPDLNGEMTPKIPPSAGMSYDKTGQMVFGPTPAGQALAGSSDVLSSGISPLNSGSTGGGASAGGGGVTTGVGGGMAGAFVSTVA